MLKIIKWYVMTCAMIISLSAEMAQAGRNKLQANNIQGSGGSVHGKDRKVVVSKDLQAVADQTTRASYVIELDRAAARWDFTNFNFTILYQYFEGYISHVAFLKATQAGDFSSIANLAQALVNNGSISTLSEAKFFIYSVLKASYDRGMEAGEEDRLEFYLLTEANDTMASYLMDTVKYHNANLGQGYTHAMISSYQSHFLENSAITRVQLTNQLSSLVTVINTYANISEKCKQEFAPRVAAKKPQLSELLTYYSEHEHAVIFAFLVFYPLEIETVGDCPMRVETALKQQAFIALKNLWAAAVQSGGEGEVAKIAIYLLGLNPLSGSQSIVVHQPAAASVSYVSPSSYGIDPANAVTILLRFYPRLTNVLPLGDAIFNAHLLSNGIMEGNLRDEIAAEPTRARKAGLFLQGIQSDLAGGDTTRFGKILALSRQKDFGALKSVAKDMLFALKLTDQQLLELYPIN